MEPIPVCPICPNIPPQYTFRLMRGLIAKGTLRTLPGGALVLDAGTGTGTPLALDARHRLHARLVGAPMRKQGL